MSLLHDIRKQSRRTREIMFGLSVVTTIALVGAIWIRSFQHDMYALLNPDQSFEQKFYADSGNKNPGVVDRGFESLRAGIYGLLNLNKDSAEVKSTNKVDATPSPVYVLPLANDRYH